MGGSTDWRIGKTRRALFFFARSRMGMATGIGFFSPKGKGLVEGWALLEEKIKGL